MSIVVTFENVEDAARVDLSRIGVVAGGNATGTRVIVEPDYDTFGETERDILRSALLAVGINSEVTEYHD